MENRRKNEWERCLVERGEGERKVVGPSCFLSGPTTIQSLQNGEKMGQKRRKSELDKIALLHPMANFLFFSTFVFPSVFFYLFIYFFLAFAYFINK